MASGGVHGLGGYFGGGGGERGEDAAGVEPAGTIVLTEDCLPVEVAGLDLADGGVAAVRAARGRAHAEAAFSEVEAVAHGAADAVVGDPLEQGGVDAALEDEVFDEAADGVLSERGSDGGAQAEAAAQAAGHVVLAAAFPNGEVAGGVDAALAGVEAQHDFAQTQRVPAAVCVGNVNRFHRFPLHGSLTLYRTGGVHGGGDWDAE